MTHIPPGCGFSEDLPGGVLEDEGFVSGPCSDVFLFELAGFEHCMGDEKEPG